MKKSKLLLCLLTILMTMSLTTGCGKTKDSSVDSSSKANTENKSETKVKANCEFYECIDELSTNTTVEEANKIIGIDGVLTDEKYNFYEYDFGNDKKIILKFYSSDKPTISVDYDKDDLKNKKVTLKNLTELKGKINDGITYEQFKEAVGGVDGTLYEKSTLSNKYVWVTENGGYVSASFSVDSGNCTFFSGFGS